jgi:hypothetical protein
MAKGPGSVGVIAVRTHDTHNLGPGPVTIRPESGPHHATEA